MKIGVIGLGAMGDAFARNLLKAGHQVVAWNRSAGPLEAFRRDGGKVAKNIEAAFDADATLSMLAADDAYRELFIESGLLDRIPKGSLHVVMATISVAFAKEFAAAHADRGLRYLAAPVLGNSAIARDAKVHVLVAGDPAAVVQARPAFEAIGQSVRIFGMEPFRANVAKIVANFVLGSAVETLGEALALEPRLRRRPGKHRRDADRDDLRRARLQDLRRSDAEGALRAGRLSPQPCGEGHRPRTRSGFVSFRRSADRGSRARLGGRRRQPRRWRQGFFGAGEGVGPKGLAGVIALLCGVGPQDWICRGLCFSGASGRYAVTNMRQARITW